MSLQAFRKELKGLRDSVKDRPIEVLLNCDAEKLTDQELTKLLTEIPVRQLPTPILLTVVNRAHGNNFKCLSDLQPGYLEKMRKEYFENEPAVIEKGNIRDPKKHYPG